MDVEQLPRSANLVVVQQPDSQELVNSLKDLLARAEAGSLTGFAYITLEPGGRYSGDVLGTARRLPILALGVIKALEAQVTATPKRR